MTTYQLIVLGKSGMYTYGDRASTPELSKLVPGNLVREGRLGVRRLDEMGDGTRASTLVEAESKPNEWTTGAEMSR